MDKAIENGFDILLTIDKNLEHQQNLNNYDIAVVVLDSKRSTPADLLPLIPTFLEKIPSLEKGKVHVISSNS